MTAEDVYRYATAPIRTLTTRLHQDLAAFAGIGWLPITLTCLAAHLAVLAADQNWTWFAIFAFFVPFDLAKAGMRHQVVQGRHDDPTAWALAAIIWWVPFVVVPIVVATGGDLPKVTRFVFWLGVSLYHGSLAYRPDDDKGLPWLTKAWRAIKTAARPRTTAPVGA